MKYKSQKQNILFICQNFWPENFRSTDVVNNLVNSGYHVEVLTSNPNYPEGKIYDGYKWYESKSENYKKKFFIHRVPTIPRGKSNFILIFLNYLAFIIFGTFFGLAKFKNKKFDYILVFASSPIFQVYVGFVLKLFKKIKLVTWVQDLWPENLIALKLIKNNFLINLINFFTNQIYKFSDILIAQSISFKKILSKRSNKKVFYIPNYAEIFKKKKIKKRINKKFTIVYAGNIGRAQKLTTLLKAVKKINQYHKIKIIVKIFGDGAELNKLKKFKKKNSIKNIYFFGKVSKEKIYKEYINSDVLFLSLAKNKFLNFTIPAKLQSYYSIGKPILASASGETKKIILSSKAGYCSPPENATILYKNILKLINLDKKKLKKLGENSKKYFNKNFSEDIVTNMFKKILI